MYGKNIKHVSLIICLVLLTAGTKLTGAESEKPNTNHEITVGIYSGERSYGANGLYLALKDASGIRASFIKDFSNSSLREKQVILIPCWMKGKGMPDDWRQRLRTFVKSGGGIIITHNSVGYDGVLSDNLFPEIAGSKGGGRFDTYEPFTVKDKTHQVSQGLDKLCCAYGDYIGMRNGPDGKVIFEDSSGYGVVVAGRIGKGRVVMTGIPLGLGPGGKEMPPQDSEKRLLINSINWAGNGPAVTESDEFDKILNSEKLVTEIKHNRDTLLHQLEVAGNELETLLDIAEFNLEQARNRIPPEKFHQYLTGLKIKRKEIIREIDAAKQQYSDEFSAILMQLDAKVPLSQDTIDKFRKAASKLPNPEFSDLYAKRHVSQYFGVSNKLLFSIFVNFRERQNRYFPPIKKLKDKLAADIKSLCDETARFHTINPDSAAVPRKFDSSASWLQNTYLLNMDDKGFTVDMRMEDVVRYLAHYGFNIVEQHPENGAGYLRKLDSLLAPYGIKQIFWPAGRREIIATVGKVPEKPYIFNPEMLAWRKRLLKYTYETTRKSAPNTFLGLQFDEVLIENVTLATKLMPENISPDDRNDIGKKFQEYLQQKYNRSELQELDLAGDGKIHVPFSGDRKSNKVLWMEYQEFISDVHYQYWKQIYDYAHDLDKDIVVWLLLNRGCFVCHPFTSRWSRLTSIPDVVASSLWMGGSPSLAFFLDLLRTNSRGISVFTSCTAHDGDIETYRRALAISRAHSQGNHFFSWPMVFKFSSRGSIRTIGEQLIDTPEKIWDATVEHTEIVNKTMPYLVKTSSSAPIALLYSERNVTLEDYAVPYTTYGPCCKKLTGLYLAFAHAHIPVDLLFLDGLKPERLAKYRVVVLSGAGAMTGQEVKLIKDWVKNGGSLIATGGVSLLDQWGRPQQDYQLAEVFGCSFKSSGNSAKILTAGKAPDNLVSFSPGKYDEIVPANGKVLLRWDENNNPAFVFNQYGKGACWFLSTQQPGLSLTASGMNVRSPFARNIKFFPGFLRFFRECILTSLSRAGDQLPFVMENCPEDVEITMKCQKSCGRIIFHLINHALDNLPVTRVKLGIPGKYGESVKIFYGLDKKPVRFENDGKFIWLQIRDFDNYEMIIIE